MAFIFSKTTPATFATCVFNFKEQLKAAGWTVTESGTGTGGTYSGAADLITTGTIMNGNQAWFRIVQPGGGISLIIQRSTGAAAQYRLKYSRSAGFTAGAPAAGITSDASDEQFLLGGGPSASPTFDSWFGGTEGTHRFNVAADNASPYGFWSGAFPTGGGVPTNAFVHDPLIVAEPTDGDKRLFHIGQSSSFLSSAMCDELATSSGRMLGFVAAVSPTTFVVMNSLFYRNNNTSASIVPNGLPTNPINAKDELFPILYARRAAVASPGYKGVGTIMRWTGTARTTGDTMNVSGARDRIIYRDVALPWDGSIPNV